MLDHGLKPTGPSATSPANAAALNVSFPDECRTLLFGVNGLFGARGLARPIIGPQLPIDSRLAEIARSVMDNRVTVLVAETGAGKSIRVPQYLAQALNAEIVVTEPRVVAAQSLADRVAEELLDQVGKFAGYRTALYRSDSPETRVLYCTDGLELVREVLGNKPTCDVLVIDELHEWNLNMEVLLGWAQKRLQEEPNFRLVLMSATLEAQKLKNFFPGSNLIEVAGRCYEVTERRPGKSIEADVEALVADGKNVLVFQPGKAEIYKTIESLERRGLNAVLLPLHSELTLREQQRVFEEYPRPKVVVSTNIARTSLTIPDMDAVVASGVERVLITEGGVEGLYLRPLSRAARQQEKGRIGRTKGGIFIDHCPAPLHSRPEHCLPEIARIRPDQAVLRLAANNVAIDELRFYHQPPRAAIEEAQQSLRALGCLDASGKVTETGHKVASLPVSIEGGKMLLEAEKLGVLDRAISAVAILEGGAILDPESDEWRAFTQKETSSDLLAQTNIFETLRTVLEGKAADDPELKEICEAHGVIARRFVRARDNRDIILKAFARNGQDVPVNAAPAPKDLRRAICAGLVEHVYRETPGEDRPVYHNGIEERELSKTSVINGGAWVVGVPFDLEVEREEGNEVIYMLPFATKIDPKWLLELCPHLLETRNLGTPRYDAASDRVLANSEGFLHGRRLGQAEIELRGPPAAETFARWFTEIMAEQKLDPALKTNAALAKLHRVNRAYADRAATINRRSDYEVLPVFGGEAAFEFFKDKLAGASRLSEIADFERLSFDSAAKS